MQKQNRWASIRTQLVGGFGLILVLVLAIALIGYLSLRNLQQGTDRTLNEASRIRELSLEIENEFLLARQSEADFLANWRALGYQAAYDRYVIDTQSHLAQARENLDEIDNLIQNTDDQELKDVLPQINELRPLLDDYERAFLTTVDRIRERSDADGLEQNLNVVRDSLEDIGASLPDPRIYELLLLVRSDMVAYFNSNSQQYVDSVRLRQNEFDDLVFSLPAESLRNEEGDRYTGGTLSLQMGNYVTAFNALVSLDREVQVNTIVFRDATSDINRLTSQLGQAGESSLDRAQTEQQRISDQSRLALFVTALAALAIGVATTVYLARRIIRPLNQLTLAAQEIGRGNLDQNVEVSGQDEFATLGTIFNQMSDQLSDLIGSLEERVNARTRDLQIAADVSKQITTVLSIDDLLQQVVSLTNKSFDYYASFIFLLDDEKQEMVMAAGANRTGELFQIESHIPLDANPSIVAEAARQRTTVLINDTLASSVFMAHPDVPDTHAELAVPMVLGDKLIGVFDIQSSKVDRFSDDDVRVLTSLAEQIGVAVRNAELFKEAQEAQVEAEQANRVKSQFLASMSHELRTPLNAILNFSQFVASGMLGEVNDSQVDALNKTVASGEHLLNLINDVLDISKIEAGALELFVESDVDIKDELMMVVANAEALLAGKNVQVVTQIDDDMPLIMGDKQRLRQIMLNLLSNACKFTDEGTITVTAQQQNGEIVVSVQDTGPGIAPDDHQTVFETFRQSKTGLRKGKGTGLGLPISLRLAEAHGGRLWLESELGQGATFFVALPTKSTVLSPTLR